MGIRIVKNIKYLADCALEVLYCHEPHCIVCGNDTEGTGSGEFLCKSCFSKIKRCSENTVLSYSGIDFEFKCYSSAYYSKTAKELILKLKYRRDFRSAEIFSGLMREVMVCNSIHADYITYVPVSKSTMRKRGYNQSEVIAKMLGKSTGIKTIETLKKTGKAKDQIGLGKEQRWENIKNNFRIRRGMDIEGRSFILVDDVVTTGATAFWCAETLMGNGAQNVTVLTAAKSGV